MNEQKYSKTKASTVPLQVINCKNTHHAYRATNTQCVTNVRKHVLFPFRIINKCCQPTTAIRCGHAYLHL